MADNRVPDSARLPGWEGEDLLLLESPGYRACVAPGRSGSVVAYAVAASVGWRHVLHAGTAAQASKRPTRFGCPVLFPFPGLVSGAEYEWDGTHYRLPPNGPEGASHVHGFAHDRPWTVVEANANRVALEFGTPGALTAMERLGYPFEVRLRQEVRLGPEGLSISLRAVNKGAEDAPVGLGLHPYFPLDAFGGERSSLGLELPAGASGPEGEPEDAGTIGLSGAGQVVRRWGRVASPSVVRLRGSAGAVGLRLVEGVAGLAMFAPEDGCSVSLEPTSCVLLGGMVPAAGTLENGCFRLRPGATRRLEIQIAPELWEPQGTQER